MTGKELGYYERISSSFIGRKVIKVFYEELKYEEDAEFWELSSKVHSVDMNVIFLLDNSELTQIKWDNGFYCYGIGFEKIDKLEYREGFKTISQTENQNWKNLLDKKITEIVVFWDEKEKVKIPLTWQVEFETDKLWISALEINENDSSSYYWADNITIFFTKDEEEKYGMTRNASSWNRVSEIAL